MATVVKVLWRKKTMYQEGSLSKSKLKIILSDNTCFFKQKLGIF